MGTLVAPISMALMCRVEEPSTASLPDSCTATNGPYAATKIYFDYLVGAGEQRGRYVETYCLGGLEVHHEVRFRGLLDR